MYEPNRLLSSLQSRLVNQGDNRPPKRTRRGSASNTQQLATTRNHKPVAIRGDIRIRAPNAVEATNARFRITVIRTAALIALKAKICAREVLRHDILLPPGGVVDIRKPATGPQPPGRDLGVFPRGAVRRQICRAHGEDIRTCREELRVENVVVRPHTASRISVGPEARDPGVPRCNHDRGPLEAKFHDLGALALLVGCRKLGLGAAVGDADYVRRPVYSAV